MKFAFDAHMMIRAATQDDLPFIYATWLRGLYHGNFLFKQIPRPLFLESYHRVLEAVFGRPNISISVACFKDEPSVITGYAVFQDTTLHWVHVKKAWRNSGIAKRLVPPTITQTTHLTHLGHSLMPRSWIFNPFAL